MVSLVVVGYQLIIDKNLNVIARICVIVAKLEKRKVSHMQKYIVQLLASNNWYNSCTLCSNCL